MLTLKEKKSKQTKKVKANKEKVKTVQAKTRKVEEAKVKTKKQITESKKENCNY